jgi:uncharacterized small protein (DUF1192 family)
MDLDPPKKQPTAHQLGANLERASVAELQSLLQELEAECARVQAVMEQKQRSAEAADAFFKKT